MSAYIPGMAELAYIPGSACTTLGNPALQSAMLTTFFGLRFRLTVGGLVSPFINGRFFGYFRTAAFIRRRAFPAYLTVISEVYVCLKRKKAHMLAVRFFLVLLYQLADVYIGNFIISATIQNVFF